MTQTELEIIDAACELVNARKATESADDDIAFDYKAKFVAREVNAINALEGLVERYRAGVNRNERMEQH